ncbi:unnamed protein product [Lupinus luteus]|uniref:Uncharacterized protein n=1 Tax=Lupinus luteus TaxID=3873 RepID=A0AAV1W775_LUPLU
MTITIAMKQLIFCVCVIICLSSYSAMSQTLHESSIAKIHEQWMSQYQRSYANDVEKEKRFQIFKEKLEYIEKFNNNANNSYKMGLNQFSDLTTDEFLASYTSLNAGLNVSSQISFSSDIEPLKEYHIPASIDWREKGAVTNVRWQGPCGACWAFAGLAAVESYIKIKTGNKLSLSVQNVVDCAASGCNGGYVIDTYKYIVETKGIADEASYPYKEVGGTCRREKKVSAQITGYKTVPPNDEQQLLRAVSKQPVATHIAVSPEFTGYKEGVFEGPCGTDLVHAVTIVGYGTSKEGKRYWLIKNSWGEQWGEGGYMRLLRGVSDKRGLCALAMWPTYPR